jgi:plastocyanin
MPKLTRRFILKAAAATPALAYATSALAASHTTAHAVSIKGFKFDPEELDVAVGDTIVFTNADNAPHTATADGGAFDTGRLNANASAEVTITAAGDYPYHCNFHGNMKALIRAS